MKTPTRAMKLLTTATLCVSAICSGLFVGCGNSGGRQAGSSVATGSGSIGGDDAFLDAYAKTYRFSLGRPKGFTVLPDGKAVLFLRSGPRSNVQDLYEFDIATGKERVILTADQILAGESENLSAEEKARRERMRMTSRGITSYDLSQDGAKILVPLSGRLFVVTRSSGDAQEITSRLSGEPAIDPQFSPDGSMVACVRGGDVYVHSLGDGSERKITPGGTEQVTFGQAEFVAQEEMGRFHGYWWSPDGQMICYQSTDVTDVPTYHIADPMNPQNEPDSWPYPKCGTVNAQVSLWLTSAQASGQRTRVTWDQERYPYLANVVWSKNAPLTFLVQNREQTEQVLLAADASGATSTLLKETDSAWLNIAESCPKWTEDGSQFIWLTESRGEWTVELRRRDGSLLGPLTLPGSGVQNVLHLDSLEGAVYVLASGDATQSHVWKVPLTAAGGSPRKLTGDRGVHGGTFGERTGIWVHTFNTLDGKIGATVRKADGSAVGDVTSVAEAPPFTPQLELTQINAGEVFHAMVLRPREFDKARKYPVILSAYTGPGVQVVKSTGFAYHLQQWMADQGYIVVSVDGRGTPGRGRAWERAWKEASPGKRGNLIDVALTDQIRALKAMGERYPEMDLTRVGVTGWSFGGYFSAMAVMRYPEVFSAGLAGAPVCDFEDYDTHYTERYLGLPQANAEGYRASNVLTYCAQLERPLLIIHGTSDDNVYFQHSLKMTEALFKSGRQFEFLPLAGFTHMVPDPVVTARLQQRMMDFFARTIQPRPE
jgi:dipeptidyl-peptidase-4